MLDNIGDYMIDLNVRCARCGHKNEKHFAGVGSCIDVGWTGNGTCDCDEFCVIMSLSELNELTKGKK